MPAEAPSPGAGYSIDVVRGKVGAELAERLVGFWAKWSRGGEQQARARVGEVVCTLSDGIGELAGISAADSAAVPLLGGRELWIYRMLLTPSAPEAAATAMLRATRDELEREYVGRGDGPIGLCVPVADPELIARHPEAVWEQSDMTYVGYTTANVQIRVSYFAGARV